MRAPLYEKVIQRMDNESEIVTWLHDNRHYLGFYVDAPVGLSEELEALLETNMQIIGGQHHG